eukprot:GAFH01001609.1.p3 GENE.GAFH01001609.1~~GAFH01001609.1.p3  ORF type:complete len:226 (-),score=112.29 GAFH01001609.1:90-767(-)
MDGSTRSAHSNAFFFGFLKNKRVVLYDTLLAQLSLGPLLAVLMHEVGHWLHGHLWKRLGVLALVMLGMLALFARAVNLPVLYTALGFHNERPVVVGLASFFLLAGPAMHLLGFFSNLWSRRFEYQADANAAAAGMSQDLGDGLVAISVQNKGNMNPDWLYSMYHYSHPTLLERLRALGWQPRPKSPVGAPAERTAAQLMAEDAPPAPDAGAPPQEQPQPAAEGAN